MTNLSILEVILNTKNHNQFDTNMFSNYINKHFEGKFFWKFIKIDLQN